jgi:hypothetical protein
MFVRTVVAVTLFTSLLGAADSKSSDIFSVRSFTDPKTKAKIPVTGQLFASADANTKVLKQALKEALELGGQQCAIPLTEAKVAKTKDRLSQPGGDNFDRGSVVKAPVAACKGWN